MKNGLLIILLLLVLISNLSGILDTTEQEQEKLREQVEGLKFVKGVLVTGRGKVIFGYAKGDGNAFTNYEKVRDYNQIIQLDLNFNANPLESIRCVANIRAQNDISGFYAKSGDVLEVRDIFVEFILFRFIQLRGGTIYEKYTPFTLIAPVNLIPLDAPLLKIYKEEALYDNFLNQNGKFPLEGLEAKTGFLLGKLGSLNLNGFAAKLDGYQSDGNSYDRYLFGTQINTYLLKMLTATGTITSLQDLLDTGTQDPNEPRYNYVISGAARLDIIPFFFSEKFFIKSAGADIEIAQSKFNENKKNENSQDDIGYANRLGGFININDMLKADAGVRMIDYEFVSPGAQSRVATSGASGDYFSDFNIQPVLYHYSFNNKIMLARDNGDMLNYTYAMNEATPNRTGLYTKIYGNLLKWIEGKVDFSQMKEIRPIARSNQQKRSFLRQSIQIAVNGPEIIDFPFLPVIQGFIITENVKRDDEPATTSLNPANTNVSKQLIETEDFKSIVKGASITIEVLKKLSVSAIYQIYNYQGRKFIDIYKSHEPIEIDGYTIIDYKEPVKNNLQGIGITYHASKLSVLQGDYIIQEYENTDPVYEKENYSIENWRLLLRLRF